MILLTASLIISLVFTISLTGLHFLNTDWLIQLHFSTFISIPHIPNSVLAAEKLKILRYFSNLITALVFFPNSFYKADLPMQNLKTEVTLEAILPSLLFLIAPSEWCSALLYVCYCCCCCFCSNYCRGPVMG